MNAGSKDRINAAIAAHVARERAWLSSSRGRWVVMERGPGQYLTNSPKHVRRYVDAVTPRRARRFSSLSRARAFARLIGGNVRRWRSTPPGGGTWQCVSPLDRANAHSHSLVSVGLEQVLASARDALDQKVTSGESRVHAP